MDWLASNWDSIMTVLNTLGLLLVSTRKRPGGVK